MTFLSRRNILFHSFYNEEKPPDCVISSTKIAVFLSNGVPLAISMTHSFPKLQENEAQHKNETPLNPQQIICN